MFKNKKGEKMHKVEKNIIKVKKFDTFNRYPLGSTPLSIILKKKINIEKNAKIESLKTNQKTHILRGIMDMCETLKNRS